MQHGPKSGAKPSKKEKRKSRTSLSLQLLDQQKNNGPTGGSALPSPITPKLDENEEKEVQSSEDPDKSKKRLKYQKLGVHTPSSAEEKYTKEGLMRTRRTVLWNSNKNKSHEELVEIYGPDAKFPDDYNSPSNPKKERSKRPK